MGSNIGRKWGILDDVICQPSNLVVSTVAWYHANVHAHFNLVFLWDLHAGSGHTIEQWSLTPLVSN
jgi:hypothetical protein